MRLLYLDFNQDIVEDYSPSPRRYGGGRIVASHLLKALTDAGHYMEIWADEKCFDNVQLPYLDNCLPKDVGIRVAIGKGEPLKKFTTDQWDAVLHHNGGCWVNTEGMKAVPLYWAVGYGEQIHAGNQNIILYNDYQSPRPMYHNPRFFRARIGVPIPKFEPVERVGERGEKYIFSCHRQVSYFGSEVMCKLAKHFGWNYYFAGPLDNGCNVMQYVDDKIKYLGIISEEEKIKYQRHAWFTPFLHSWPTPFNLSAVSALACGIPIISTRIGFWPSLLAHGINGFFVDNHQEMLDAIQNIDKIESENCYQSALYYSSDNMVKDYLKIFEELGLL